MKTFILLLVMFPSICPAQFGASFHQSKLPFAGINYEINDRFRPEIRFGTDAYFESVSLEAVFTYDILNKEDHEIYIGAGYSGNGLNGLVVPIGINAYPFNAKQLGFHMELTPVIEIEQFSMAILRGSWGVRYRFRK